MRLSRFSCSCCAALLLALLLGGCATRKVDWASRVGSYTFDQAIAEFGPPDKQAKLTDGTLVADWLTRRGYHQFYAAGGYYGSAYRHWQYSPAYVDTYSPDYFLRLTFGADGRLKAWKKVAR